MVCCMYYTDVFVGSNNNIEKLKKALEAELEGSVLPVDLTQLTDLASGLGFLAGLPACLCKTKKSVEEGLRKIYEELNKNILLISCDNFNISKLNCDSCDSKLYPCKCCVIQSIKEVKGSCECLKGKAQCHCKDKDVSCSKVLAGLEACLHLQCLQSDMNDICQCKASDTCCLSGKCNGKSGGPCGFCENLQTQPTTGLGLSPPNPIRLAERLEIFFGTGGKSKNSCTCKCGTSGSSPSCCCLACQKCSSQNCSCGSNCSCDKALKTSQCPCREFCLAINSIQVSSGSSLMKCCDSGAKCHCQLQSSSPCSSNCCVSKSPSKRFNQQSLKCMLRRLVSYFKDLNSSPDKFFKSCCDLLCVAKTCWFLWDFYDKRTQNICWTCKDGGKGGSCPSNGKCCAGPDPKCNSSPCPKCDECQQICYAKEFSRALEDLKYSSPCGQDLWRTLDAFIQYCCFVFYPRVKGIQSALENLHSKCKCSGGSCKCSTQGSCDGCAQVLSELRDNHKDLLSLMTRGYSSAYSSKDAKWNLLCSHTSQCSGCSKTCPCQGSFPLTPCPDNGCCENCDVRKAAKIFLGMLPCLFHALQYLYKQCKKEQQDGGWKNLNIKDNSSLTSLGRFLVGMGYEIEKLQGKTGQEISSSLSSLFTSSNGPLQSLYEKSKKYFPSPSPVPSSDSDSKPKTVRDILLWLSGLPFTSGFKDLLKHCESLCSATKDSVKFNDFESSLYASCLHSPFVLATIQWPGKSEIFYHNFSEISKFFYPEDPFKLFETFCDFVRKIYIPLTFFYFQCKRVPGQAGWKECYFGQKCSVEPLSSTSS
ncbi:variant erythrocyte surface antigen-1 family protein, partial [Babesia divergens]